MVENKQNKLELRDKIIAFAMPEFYKRGEGSEDGRDFRGTPCV